MFTHASRALRSLQVTALRTQLREQTDRCDSLSEQLATTDSQSEERATAISRLTQEVERLTQEVKVVIDGVKMQLIDVVDQCLRLMN